MFGLPYTGNPSTPVYPTPRGEPQVNTSSGDKETFVFDDGTHNQIDYGFSGESNKDIQEVGEWLYDEAKVTPDKNNITHAYAKAYRIPIAGKEHLVINFGADRYSNNGDAALGFWFFQDEVSRGPQNRRGVGTFEGEHVDGDILVQVDFVQGGTRANKIQIFEWQSDGLGSHGKLNQLAYEEGVGDAVCIDDLDPIKDDSACAQTNSAAWPSPWAYNPKAGANNIFGVQTFFEGRIDVTKLIDEEVCFSSFMAETRSSHSETAELKDFALGSFELCSIDLVRKSCEAASTTVGGVTTAISPVYLPSTNRYQTQHVIDIKNDGFGTVYDLAIRDTAVTSTSLTTGNSCKITAISGSGVNPVSVPTGGIQLPAPDSNPNTDDAWVTIADGLSHADGSNTMRITLLCNSASNPFVNSAEVRAAPLTGLPATITDSYAETDAIVAPATSSDVRPQCVKTLTTGLTLTKNCPDPVVLKQDASDSNKWKPYVCVDITLKNDGDGIMDIASFVDTRDDTSTQNLLLLSPTNIATGTDGLPELQPGATATVKDCYFPTQPNGSPVGGIFDPDQVVYGDTVSASGYPHNAPTTLKTATAQSITCPLCPIGRNN